MLDEIAQHRQGAGAQADDLLSPVQAAVRDIKPEGPEGDVVLVLHEGVLSSNLHGIYTVRSCPAAEFTRCGPGLIQQRSIYFVSENDNLEMPCTGVAVQEVGCAPIPTVSPDQSGVFGAIPHPVHQRIAL